MFVGRVGELARIEALLDRVDDGPWVAAVEGPAGIGKSSLLREFSRRARARGVTVLAGRGTEFEQAVPFGLFAEAMEFLAEGDGPRSAGGAASAEPGLERGRLHRGLRDAIAKVCRDTPVVIVLDDVQWADEASIGLLASLVDRPPEGPVSLLLAHRGGQCPARLERAFAGAAVPPIRLRVPPLGAAEVDELIPWLGAARRRALARESDGNPLFLLLLADLPGSEGSIPDRPIALLGEEPANSLERTVRAEFAALAPTDRLVAQASAVGGQWVSADLVAAIAQLPEDEVLDRLDRLIARGSMTADAGRFGFVHPLLRAAAYRSAGPGWRIGAHRRAVGFLAAAGAPLMLRAQHLEHALRPGDAQGADELVEAARVALASAPATSVHWLDRVLRTTPHEPTGDHVARGRIDRIRMLLGRALLASGALERAAAVLRALVDEGGTRNCEALALLAQCERMLGRSDHAYQLLLSRARTQDGWSGAVILELATLDLMHGRIEQGMLRVRELARSEERDNPEIIAAVEILLALAAVGRGDVDAARSGLTAADRHLGALSDGALRRILDAVLPAMAWAAYLIEEHELALRHIDRGIRTALAHGHSFALPHLYAAQACTLVRLGHLAEALEAAEDAQETAVAFGASDMLAIAGSIKLRPLLWRDGPRPVQEHWDEALRLPTPAADWFRRSVATILIDVALQVGLAPPPSAIAGLDMERAAADRDPTLATRHALSAQLALAEGDAAEAARHCELAVRAAEVLGRPGQLGTALLARAKVALHQKRFAEAAVDARASAELFGEAGIPVQQGQASLLAGQAAGLAGEEDATALLAAARKVFAAVDAPWLDGLAAREQRSLTARGPRRRGAETLELSAREQQVAELAASGLTNRDIGERLTLSPRTVETHLARAFTKLGVGNRVALARLLGVRERAD